MQEPIRVVARMIARPEKENEVKSILSGLIQPTHQESGCLHYELIQNRDTSNEFVMVEEWESQAALDSHANSSHIKNAQSKMQTLMETPPDVRFFRTVA